MSQKSKLYKQRREARQEKQAKTVIKWIIISLFILALVIFGYSIYLFG
ncbi:UNVERIFIED_CONTAM: hypothetical protein NY100_02225 [Prevotella sp. 15_C9]